MVIGLTGQIGAGKSLAAAILRGFGAHVISADEIGKVAVDRSADLRRRLARAFGADILSPGGKLRRKLLAQRAFADERGSRTLNDLVHPQLLKELQQRVRSAARQESVVVIDAALVAYRPQMPPPVRPPNCRSANSVGGPTV